MRDVYVLGIGQTKFGKLSHYNEFDLGAMATDEALKDAGISPKDIEVAYSSCVAAPPTAGQIALQRVGITGIPIINVENACGSGNTAFHLLYKDIAAGYADVGLAIGFQSFSERAKKEPAPKGVLNLKEDLGGLLGLSTPSYFSLTIDDIMEKRNATREDMAYPSVKNHYNSQFNPLAHYQKPVTLEKVLNAPEISSNIGLLECCPQSDGGASIILCSKSYFEKNNINNHQKVKVIASVMSTSEFLSPDMDPFFNKTLRKVADNAYEIGGVRPEDINFVELHDAFSGEELASYEPLRLCPDGEAIKFMKAGHFDLDGKCPVNPSGGLLSVGHPLGATGIRMNCDATRQLRGIAGGYQVSEAKVGLVQMYGSLISTMESPPVSFVHILRRED